MNVYKEIKKIAELNETIVDLNNNLEENGFDTDGLDFRSSCFIRNCIEENGHLYDCDGNRLDNSGLVDDDYYCCQYTGYCEDDFYGTLYYATDEEGVFVAVPFAM